MAANGDELRNVVSDGPKSTIHVMIDFASGIHESSFFSGCEIRGFNLRFSNESGGFELTLTLHWWPEADLESQAPHSQYNRGGKDHRLISYRFDEVGDIEMTALTCTNGDQIYA